MRAAAVRLREPGNVKAPAITGNGMAFARLPSKKGAMKHTDRTGAEQTAARQPEPTQEITVTQVTPDDILNDGGPITPATGDGTPTERQSTRRSTAWKAGDNPATCRLTPQHSLAAPHAADKKTPGRSCERPGAWHNRRGAIRPAGRGHPHRRSTDRGERCCSAVWSPSNGRSAKCRNSRRRADTVPSFPI